MSRRSRTKKESESVADVDSGTGTVVGATPEEMKQIEAEETAEPEAVQEAEEAPKKRTRRVRKERKDG